MKFKKFTHPRMSGFLITTLEATPEDFLVDYLDPAEDTVAEIKTEEVEMTREEFDALPEFEG